MTTLGLRGDSLFDGSWGYDAGFRYSQIRNISTGTFVSGVLFDRILNANDPIFDPSSKQYIGTTIPFNPFTDYRVPFSSNSATVNFATVHPTDIDTSKLATLDATIYTTALFHLPAGGVGLAFGGEFRREKYRTGYRPFGEWRYRWLEPNQQHGGGTKVLRDLCGGRYSDL